VFVIFACATKKVSGCWQIDPSSLAYEGHGLYYCLAFLGRMRMRMRMRSGAVRIINVARAKEAGALQQLEQPGEQRKKPTLKGPVTG